MSEIRETFLNIIPPYTRIKRLIRDIPATEIAAGSNVTNLSQLMHEKLLKEYKANESAAKAFYKNKKLKKITIPASVVKIGKQAFFGCKNLKTITIKTKKLTSKSIGAKAFKGTHKKARVKTPAGKSKAYKKILRKKGLSKKAKVK